MAKGSIVGAWAGAVEGPLIRVLRLKRLLLFGLTSAPVVGAAAVAAAVGIGMGIATATWPTGICIGICIGIDTTAPAGICIGIPLPL